MLFFFFNDFYNNVIKDLTVPNQLTGKTSVSTVPGLSRAAECKTASRS